MIGIIGDALALIELLKRHYDDWGVVCALFDWEGNRVEGSPTLTVRRIPDATGRNDAWFYEVSGPEGYVFVHMPVVAGLYVDCALTGKPTNKNADARFFRYVGTPLSSAMGGVANTLVSFVVFGYPPKALLRSKG